MSTSLRATARKPQPVDAPSKYDHLVRPDGMIHRSIFIDPQIFEEEMRKVFGASWVFLLHEGEIPAANDFKSITVGRRPTIVTRSADGKIHALLNRCTHRAAMVCAKSHGNATRFQCPYHGWTFGNNGDLLAVTFPDGNAPDFDHKAHALGRFPRVESYRGYVFGSLNPDVEPLTDWLGAAKEIIDWSVDIEKVGDHSKRVIPASKMVYRGNWKLQNDNNADSYHAQFLHASTAKMNHLRYGPGKLLDHVKGDETPMFTKYLGNGHKLIDQRPAIGSPWDRARPVPGRELLEKEASKKLGEDARRQLDLTARAGINLVIYPNLLVYGNGVFAVYEPVAVDQTNVRWFTAMMENVPEEVNLLRIRFNEDFTNVAAGDDNEAFEQMQTVLTTIPEMEWLDMSRGLGTSREVDEGGGVIRGNIMDETAIRRSYDRWKELMALDVPPSCG